MENEKKLSSDILTEADVEVLVHTFYDKVRQDNILASVFNDVISDWDFHLTKMITFWSTILLYTRQYKDDPMPKHLPLPIGREHFDRWLQLFNQTIDELFNGQIADNARKRAASIARIMLAVKENQ